MNTRQLQQWIASDDFRERLSRLQASNVTPQHLIRLRRELPRRCAELLFEVAAVQSRVAAKFAGGAHMLATRRGVEQATGAEIARWKASRFPLDCRTVDFCCGIGGDTLALATSATDVLAVDRDPIVAALLRQNAQLAGRENITVCAARCESLVLPPEYCWHLDPDRRPNQRRTTQVEYMQPAASWIDELLERCAGGAVKLAPTTVIPPSWRAHSEATWISHHGECRQLVLWFGALARHLGRRAAVKIMSTGEAVEWIERSAEHTTALAPAVESLLCELDTALLAADLGHDFARHHGLVPLTPRAAYCTANDPTLADSPWLRTYTVNTILPQRISSVIRWLRANNARVVEVKQRGVTVKPQEWLRKLQRAKLTGRPKTLIATRVAERHVAMVAERIGGPA